MDTLFQNILKAGLSGSVVIGAVICLRLILRRTPKKLICLLWLMAGLRLVLPFEIESSFSLQPRQQVIPQSVTAPMQEQISVIPEVDPVIPDTAVPQVQPQRLEQPALPDIPYAPYKPSAKIHWEELFPLLWLMGVAVMGIVSAVDYWKLKKKVREAWRTADGYWECTGIDTAFILGFLPPRIYLPANIREEERSFVLRHEKTHLILHHHWFKLVGYGILALHWFNPLVWIGYSLMCRDIEMACDEQVIRDMSVEQRKAYSETLLNFCTRHSRLAACPVAFGESDPKRRILSVLRYRKPGFWITVVGVAALVFVAVCLMTSPKEELKQIEIPALSYEQSEYSLRVNERINPNVTFNGKTMDHESEAAVYHFDAEVPEKERDAFVFYGDAILSRFASEKKPQIVILHEYDGAWISGNTLYLGADADSLDYGTKLITLLCGGYANYGAAYGYADYIAVAEGWKEEEEGQLTLTDNAARDMNWLCFRDRFVSDREIETNKAAAICFAKDYIEANGEVEYRNLLRCSGSVDTAPEFSQALSDWYDANGIDYMPSSILYGIGGEYHDYLVKCPYAEFILPKDWDNRFTSYLTQDEDFLHQSYEETKYCFETNAYQMACIQQDLGFDSYDNDLTVEFILENEISTADIYYRTLRINSIDDLTTLYVYWLTMNPMRLRDYGMNSPYVGVSRYVALKNDCSYESDQMRYCAEHGMQPGMYQMGEWNELFTGMMAGETDPMVIQATRFHFGAYYFDDYYSDPGMGIHCSFPWYLIDKYGYESILDYTYDRGSTPMDLDMASEKQEWIAWIEETYSAYPKYSDFLREEAGETIYVCSDQNCTDPNHDHAGRDCAVSNCTDSSHHHEQSHTNTSQGHHHDH